MKQTLFSMITLAFLISCQASHTHGEFDKEVVVKEVHQMFDHFFADIKASGLTAEFKYLDNSPDFFWVPPGYQSALDYDSVKVILETNAPKYRSVQYEWGAVRVVPLTNSLANYAGIVNCTLVDTAGNTTELSLIESGVLIKRSHDWKYLSGQTALLDGGANDSP